MKRISPEEIVIRGSIVESGKLLTDNDACLRINWLMSDVLENLGVRKDSGGWERLYRDPADGRYWLVTYPHGEMHGGGPPDLRNVTLSEREMSENYFSREEWAERMRKRNIRFISPNDSSEKPK